MEARPLILLVEDDENDEMLALRAIRNSGLACDALVARDGEQALNFLFPLSVDIRLVLLDLSLPKVNGFELLQRIRECDATSDLPVVILSSSDDEGDLRRSASLRANSYVRKLVDPRLHDCRIKVLLHYWLTVHERFERRAPLAEQSLSVHERQVLRLASTGMTDKEIAMACSLTPTAVRTCWDRIREKTRGITESHAAVLGLNLVRTRIEDPVVAGPAA